MEKNISFNIITSKIDIGQRLDYFLAKKLPDFSRSCIKKWISENKIIVNNNIINKSSKKIKNGMEIRIRTKLNIYNTFIPQNIDLSIKYEDNDILIIDKHANLVVHPGAGNLDGTILNALLYHYPNLSKLPRAGIVHRLDKNTTGLMIVAKNLLSQINLIKQIKLRAIVREYHAIVIGQVKKDGIINAPISRHMKKRTCMSVNLNGKYAITKYYVVENFCSSYTHLRILLETGRTHQIRVHMAYINHPLIGDSLYGTKLNFLKASFKTNFIKHFTRQALHASSLEFKHPITGIQMKFNSSLPKDMYDLINNLKSI